MLQPLWNKSKALVNAAKNVLANVELCRDQAKSESELPNTDFKGYCTPDQFCSCLCIFLENHNTLVTNKINFL